MALQDLEMSPAAGEPPSSISDHSLRYNTRCCFCFPSSSSGSAWWDRFRSSSSSTPQSHDDPWWSRGVRTFKKIREWSEIVAGPKWKTFIRRFNRNKTRHGQFQYDPLSYALNFDEGGQSGEFNEEDDYGGFRDFSSRYAAVSVSGKPLAMDASGNHQVVVA
ncbi:hypothetical protein M5689_017270 [Euphorbia peplus]|nr:hypothetical protein M5689_017270 [Euphorbia peplus]